MGICLSMFNFPGEQLCQNHSDVECIKQLRCSCDDLLTDTVPHWLPLFARIGNNDPLEEEAAEGDSLLKLCRMPRGTSNLHTL